jgi:hypothetical protein
LLGCLVFFLFFDFAESTMAFSAIAAFSPTPTINMFRINIENIVVYRVPVTGGVRPVRILLRGRLELDLRERKFELFDRHTDESVLSFPFEWITSGETRFIKGKRDSSKKYAKIILTLNNTLGGDDYAKVIIKMDRLDSIRVNANFLPAYYVAIGRI